MTVGRLAIYTGHLKRYKTGIVGTASVLGLISDILQPLAAFSKWILIGCGIICALSVPLLSFDRIRKSVVSIYVYALLMCLICGPLYGFQISGLSEYGVLASIFPPVHTLQDTLGITKKLDDISSDVKDIKGNVIDIKEEVTKEYRAEDLLALVINADDNGKVDLLYDLERYPIKGPLQPNEFVEIFFNFPANYRDKLVDILLDSLKPELTAKEYFSLVDKKAGIQNIFWDLGPKLKSPLTREEIVTHLKGVPEKYREDHFSGIAGYMETMSAADVFDLGQLMDIKKIIITVVAYNKMKKSSEKDIIKLKNVLGTIYFNEDAEKKFTQ